MIESINILIVALMCKNQSYKVLHFHNMALGRFCSIDDSIYVVQVLVKCACQLKVLWYIGAIC